MKSYFQAAFRLFQTRIGLQILKIKLIEKVSDGTDDILGQIVCILHKY